MYSIVAEHTVDVYKKLVVENGENEREFIISCFWGGDRVYPEQEYELIKSELRKLSKL